MNEVEERIRSAFEPYRSTVEFGNLSEPSPARGRVRTRARVRGGPEQPIPQPRTTTRVVAAVVALAVFAVVIVVFVVPALRLDQPTTTSSGGTLLPLWPAQTIDELQRYQAQADAGHHPEALDPKKLAEAFGHQVLGWDHVFAFLAVDPISSICGAAVPGNPAPEFAVGCWSPGLPGQYPGPEDQPGYTPAPIESFAVLPCEPGPCDLTFYSPVDVTVYQPLEPGSDGIWAVMSASDAWLDLNLGPGQTVHDGASVNVTGSIAHGDDFRLAVTGVGGTCTFAMSTDAYDTTGEPPSASPLNANLTVNMGDATDCSETSAGYVWAAEAVGSLKDVDPLKGGGPPLMVFSAVPVTLVSG